ncbi:MAG: hypothetical protein R2851_21040 [Caldilineaceae bacterium]
MTNDNRIEITAGAGYGAIAGPSFRYDALAVGAPRRHALLPRQALRRWAIRWRARWPRIRPTRCACV